MGEMLVIDLHSCDVRHQATKDFEVEGVPFRLTASQFRLSRLGGLYAARLSIEGLDNDRRIEKQFQERIEQLPHSTHEAAVRLVQRGLGNRLVAFRFGWRRVRRQACRATQFVHERRLNRAGIKDRLEPTGGELLNLLRREIDAVPFRDP
jgi:hypothetical protein